MITSDQLRSKFLEFMESKGHAIVPSAPLVPENDSSVLFNTAGMQPMVPYLMGEEHPKGVRIANSQKCLRTNDLEEVGDDSHNTFFEMLGNWSLGDYFKEESLAWSWEFLTSPDWLGLNPDKIAVTVFEGDDDCPADNESVEIWKDIGMPEDRISYMPADDNWWALGPTGPCGPDSEIFYWVGEGELPSKGSNVKNDEDSWMEIWNNVFMVYNRKKIQNSIPTSRDKIQNDGDLDVGTHGSVSDQPQADEYVLEELPSRNVDTGMGMERTLAVLNGFTNIYESDLFSNVIKALRDRVGSTYSERGGRIAADHIRTAVHLLADGVRPGNVDQGYILRRLIRRSIRELHRMGWDRPFVADLAEMFIEKYRDAYPNIEILHRDILDELRIEEEAFSKTLIKGLREFQKIVIQHMKVNHPNFTKDDFNIHHPEQFPHKELANFILPGEDAFRLFDTYGFPIEMTVEIAEKEYGFSVDIEGFEHAFRAHQDKSRTAAAGKFKGGLADNDPQTLKLHTATHLLLAGLQKFLGDHVHQAGSNITTERLRFDFTHPEKVDRETCDQIEEFVNDIISKPCSMSYEMMGKEEAKALGVEGSFWEKYPDEVKVYTLQDADGNVYSRELCGGPHVETTLEMGTFRIKKEEASSRGVRRIKAFLSQD